MLRDVNIKVIDGQLVGESNGVGVHLKIGASQVKSDELIKIKGTYDVKRIRQILGLSPLADACMDSVENGASLIYCIPVQASTAGKVDKVEKSGTGTGTVAMTGTPNNSYNITITIVNEGGLNGATFSYSLNNGISKSDEITIPLLGTYVIPDTGISLIFTEGALQSTSFKTDDTFKATVTAPSLTNSDILGAIDKIKNITYPFEFLHIVGETTAATWAAVSNAQQALYEEKKLSLMVVLEAFSPKEGETTESYIESLIAARKGINNYDLQVVAARCDYVRMDKTIKEVNMAGIACGWYASSSVQKSIGKTDTFSLPPTKGLRLLPQGIEDQLERIDKVGYLTFRQYPGLEGLYVTNARMFCPEGSDYKYAEHTRVKNKIIRSIRKAALLQLQSEIDLSDVDGSLKAIGKILEAPIDQMVTDKEISAGRIIIPPDQDILRTEKVALKVRFTPKGYAREFEIDLGMEAL